MRPLLFLCCLPLVAAEVTTSPRKPSATSVKASATAAAPASDEAFVFDPSRDRRDVFYDREAWLVAEKAIQEHRQPTGEGSTGPGAVTARVEENEEAWANQKVEEVRGLLDARKFDEVMKAADAAFRRLERHAGVPSIQQSLVRLRTYRGQAEEAKIRNEAQAAFDALGLVVQGILWSESGSRLVIIRGEPKALAINEKAKDCTILSIEMDQVLFRFHYSNRRFEFPRYVRDEAQGQATTGAAPRPAGRR